MARCHSVCETYSPLFLSLYELFVASDSTANVELLAVRTSASLPRKPMSVILFKYISVLRFEFPNLLGSHMAKLREWARLPSADGLLFGREPKEICSAFCAGFGAN